MDEVVPKLKRKQLNQLGTWSRVEIEKKINCHGSFSNGIGVWQVQRKKLNF